MFLVTEAEMSEMNTEKTGKNSWMKKFLPIWSAQIFSLLGSGLVQFALVWYLTKETGSATILAMATFVAVIPDVLIGPFAGVLVDRWNRRVVMIVADAVIAFFTLGLAVLFLLDLVQVCTSLWCYFCAKPAPCSTGRPCRLPPH
jgi:DHA3 family macrolide efflux protein-like MFS transporter